MTSGILLAFAGCGTTTTTSDPPPPEAAATTAAASISTGATTHPETEETETVVATETETETTADDTGGYTGLAAVTYQTARDVCAYDGVTKIAKELGVARNSEAVADAYSLGSTEGIHRDASYDGCLSGLLNRD